MQRGKEVLGVFGVLGVLKVNIRYSIFHPIIENTQNPYSNFCTFEFLNLAFIHGKFCRLCTEIQAGHL